MSYSDWQFEPYDPDTVTPGEYRREAVRQFSSLRSSFAVSVEPTWTDTTPGKKRVRREPAGPWTEHAACRGMDPDLFFPYTQSGKPPGPQSDAWLAAKATCGRCPVAEECLAHAIAQGETDGMWGGLTPAERRLDPVTGTSRHGVYAHDRLGCRCPVCRGQKRKANRRAQERS